MQVSGMNDSNVAVVGGNTPKEFMLANTPEFFNILSSSLYSNPILAIVRETLCNAWDASLNAPKITLRDDLLTIEDDGPGIPDENIVQIYGTYGLSTKTDDSSQTGGFGLGCKSPFAYTDNFEVVSCCNGIQTVYQMTRASESTNGKPAIIKIASIPTKNHGLKVTIPVNPNDTGLFSVAIDRVITCSTRDTLFNDVLQEHCPPFEDFIFTSNFGKGFNFYGCCIYIKYGEVLYPLKDLGNNGLQYKMSQLVKSISYCCAFTQVLVIKAKPDSLSVTPSREQLRDTEQNRKVLHELLSNTWHTLHTGIKSKSLQYEIAHFKSYEMDWNSSNTLHSIVNNNSRLGREDKYFTKDTVYQRLNAFIKVKELLMDFYAWRLAASPFKNSFLKHAKKHITNEQCDSFSWFYKHLFRSMKANLEKVGLSISKVTFQYNTFFESKRTFTITDKPARLSISDVAHFLIPIIYLGTRNTDKLPNGNLAPKFRIFYKTTGSKIEGDQKALESLGYKVVLLDTSKQTKPKKEEPKFVTFTRLSDISNILNVTNYAVEDARKIMAPEEAKSWLVNAKAVFVINNRGAQTSLSSLSLAAVARIFSDEVIAVSSKRDMKYFQDKFGMIPLEEYVKPKVEEYFQKIKFYYPDEYTLRQVIPEEYRSGATSFIECCKKFNNFFNYDFLKHIGHRSLYSRYKDLAENLKIDTPAPLDPTYKKFLKDLTQNNIKFCSPYADEAFIHKHILVRK